MQLLIIWAPAHLPPSLSSERNCCREGIRIGEGGTGDGTIFSFQVICNLSQHIRLSPLQRP